MGMMMRSKMEVVRFKQEDVIVASGHHDHRYAKLSGWGDGIDDNAIIQFKNGKAHTVTIDALAGLLGNDGLNPNVIFHKDASNQVTLGQLADNENDYGYFNGDYENDETDGNWYGYTRQ